MESATSGRADSALTFDEVVAVEITTWSPVQKNPTGITRGVPSSSTSAHEEPRPGHTSATVLLLLGVPERGGGVMGRSNTAMAARYQHVTAAIQGDLAGRVGGLIWQASPDPSDSR